MSMYSGKPNSLNFKSDCEGLAGNRGSGVMSVGQSLVLDSEKGELVKSLGKTGKKRGVSEAKTVAALKSHSEAERRRRERINAHLETLRGLVPGKEKMDKASLLAEVISQVKQLKKTAKQASEDLHIPTDSNEVKVEQLDDTEDRSFSFRASICCHYRHDLLSDTRQCLNVLPVDLAEVEISTLEGRVKIVFVLTGRRDGMNESAEARELIASSIHEALSCVVDKASASEEFSQQLMLPHKRQRVHYLDYP
ncbi:Transcription factor bHLH [Abeliophyllum distichum]|uniref:Transcription factor bHLH n=1 Tax=Abeliophyllum distichum TaxID=126358 RepID=A0ABD1UGT5_9LAMI